MVEEEGFIIVRKTKQVRFFDYTEKVEEENGFVVVDQILEERETFNCKTKKSINLPKKNYGETSFSQINYDEKLKELEVFIISAAKHNNLKNIFIMTNNYIIGRCFYAANIMKVWNVRRKGIEIDDDEASMLGMCSADKYEEMEKIRTHCDKLVKANNGDRKKVLADVTHIFNKKVEKSLSDVTVEQQESQIAK